MNNGTDINDRLQKMKNFYLKLDEMMDKLPESIPADTQKMIKDKILGDKELKELMEGIDKNRPPRIFLVGRTGAGKSSLVNALCGGYVAEVGDVRSCTEGTKIYNCTDNNRTLMEILDTRGIAESEALNENSAENTLINEITEFSSDVAKLVLNCTHTTLYLGRCSRKYSMVKVYCYSRCTTCKKALKWLDDNKAGYKLIDIKEDHPDEKTLRQLHKKSGLSDGMLVKRPLLITGKKVLTGFKEEDWKNAL